MGSIASQTCAFTAALAALLTSCTLSTSPEPGENTESVSNALVGQDTWLYFRSNSTGWNPTDSTRLRPTLDPYVFQLAYDVKEPYMTEGGDPSAFTETNQLDGWGSQQTFYGAVHGTVNVPGGDYLATNGAGFQVKYPALGRYKVTVNWMQGMFQIGPYSAAQDWRPCGDSIVTTLAQSPQAPSNVLVGCANGDVLLTFEGQSYLPRWTKVDTWNTSAGTFGLPDLPINAIAYSPADIKTAYLSVAGSKQGHKLWKTGTGGASWVELSSVPLAEIWSISVNPQAPLKVYVAGPGGVYQSEDAGVTWSAEVTAAPLTVPLAEGAKLSTVTMVGGSQDNIWVGATNGDIFFTKNAGQTWVKATHYMPERMVTHIAAIPRPNQPVIYATFDGMSNDSLWVTSNEGFGWANLHAPELPTTPMPLPGVYGLYGVSVNPVDSTVLYIAGTYGAGMSTSGGASWTWTTTN